MDWLRAPFAENLLRHRRESGLSQEKLAMACDLDRSEISLLENRRRTPELETVVKLARGLGLRSICELLEGIH